MISLKLMFIININYLNYITPPATIHLRQEIRLFGIRRGGRGDVVFLAGECPPKTPQLPPYHGESPRDPEIIQDSALIIDLEE
jgi:hypothetical protein